MKKINFTKYEGLGNDFIIVDEMHHVAQDLNVPYPEIPRDEYVQMCRQHWGVGANGVLTLFSSSHPGILAAMHITNADGSFPTMCGNGLRCVAQWFLDNGHTSLLSGEDFYIETASGLRSLSREGDEWVVQMGIAQRVEGFMDIPLAHLMPQDLCAGFPVSSLSGDLIQIGNFHWVIPFAATPEQAHQIGSFFESHRAFPEKVNVSFVQIRHSSQIDLVTWERGVGLTKACGSAACASVALLVEKGALASETPIQVHLSGGILQVTAHLFDPINPKKWDLEMKGPACKVFSGNVEIEPKYF